MGPNEQMCACPPQPLWPWPSRPSPGSEGMHAGCRLLKPPEQQSRLCTDPYLERSMRWAAVARKGQQRSCLHAREFQGAHFP